MRNPNLALLIGMAVNIIDGFDIVAAALTGPLIAKGWSVPPSELGLLFSGLPLGLVIGALALSPLADRFGRRIMLIASLAIMSVGMALSAATGGIPELFAARILTGVGVGGAIPIVNMLGAEHAPPQRGTLWISLITLGVPLGQTIGAGVAIVLLPMFGWRSIYVVGGLGSILIMLFVALVFQRLASTGIQQDGDASTAGPRRTRLGKELLLPHGTNIALISVVFIAVNVACYFLISWTPKVLVELGFSLAESAKGSMLLTLGGICGSVIVGVLAGRFEIRLLGPFVMIAAFVIAALVAATSPAMNFFILLTFFVGLGMSASNTAMYASLPVIFPPQIRGTASGIAFGVGRLGAIVGPLAGGLLIERGLSRFGYTAVMTAPFLLGGVLLLYVLRRTRKDAIENI
jgi:MFS family permease